MGIYYAENALDYDVTSLATFRAAAAIKGGTMFAASGAQMLTSVGVSQLAASVDPDARKWFTWVMGINNNVAGTDTILPIPIPDAAKDFYISIRFRVTGSAGARTQLVPMGLISALPTSNATYPLASGTTIYFDIDRNMALHVTPNNHIESGNGIITPFTATDINQIEIFHGADGTLKMWLNELPLTTPRTTQIRPTTNFLYLCCWSGGGSGAGGSNLFTVYVNDIIVVDPSTPGLQYRPGKTARVEGVSFTGDITKDWTADASQATHYGVMNLPWRGTVPATEMLSSYAIGATERYQAGALRTDLGQMVHAVMLETQMSNTAGAAHSLDFKAAFGGAAETTVSTITYPAGAGLVYSRQMIDKNPNGNADWTLTSASSPKLGYSIKS